MTLSVAVLAAFLGEDEGSKIESWQELCARRCSMSIALRATSSCVLECPHFTCGAGVLVRCR
jgi:hypothetical protein